MRFELTLFRVKATISDLIPSWTELLNVSLLLVNSNIDIVVYIYDMYAISYIEKHVSDVYRSSA